MAVSDQAKERLCPAVSQYGPANVRDLEPGKKMKWCTCGLSKTQPWCDGAHKGTGFKSLKWIVPEKPQSVYSICMCKHTQNPPFCDATHTNLPAAVEQTQTSCPGRSDHHMRACPKLCTKCGWVPDF
ncbi:CDGSH iron-sulfur domain-containing protein 3, mitochondrial-like isoform X1 [Patiria miniata]|uniref:Iron-binding zinc finger CDGSH type domain-containing protein n=1 Tax=Patiria miniata TaxID=46514 RepID=A0A913Z597_PATMI|nr:CDGSH iron-sulfur domain-containing protein 3, mitochondrial-like isoform X1 [Patiria miniata]